MPVTGHRSGRAGPIGPRCLALLVAALAGSTAAWGAPLDALITATPERGDPRGRIELGIDQATGSLDFSTSDEPPAPGVVPPTGNYQGAQLQAAWRVTDRLWLSGGFWQRKISSDADTFRYNSWQLAGQYRFNDATGAWPAVALRLGAWGNRATETASTTPVRVTGAILDTVTITGPGDRQLQADLVATWPLSAQLDVSALLSFGRSELSYDALSATTTRNGCHYNLTFNGNDIFGNLAAPCQGTGGGVIRQFYDSSGAYGVDVAREIAWQGRCAQVGASAQWRSGPWAVAGAYLFHAARREDVDDILASRGDPVHRENHQLMLEAAYRLHPNWSPFLRAQVNSNLFFNDIPVTYNTSTSGSFGSRLSVVTLGLRAGF